MGVPVPLNLFDAVHLLARIWTVNLNQCGHFMTFDRISCTSGTKLKRLESCCVLESTFEMPSHGCRKTWSQRKLKRQREASRSPFGRNKEI